MATHLNCMMVIVSILSRFQLQSEAIHIEKNGQGIKKIKSSSVDYNIICMYFFLDSRQQRFLAGADIEFKFHDEQGSLQLAQWSNGDVRLASGDNNADKANPTSGRLEVHMNTLLDVGSGGEISGTWGAVCGIGFRLREAHVACKQLGFSYAYNFELSSVTE